MLHWEIKRSCRQELSRLSTKHQVRLASQSLHGRMRLSATYISNNIVRSEHHNKTNSIVYTGMRLS